MISASFDFKQFLVAVKHKEGQDIVYLAEKEATEAWERSYSKSQPIDNYAEEGMNYQTNLLALIEYIRCGVQCRSLKDEDITYLRCAYGR